ncbi:MAG: hypothetical protein FJY83_08490, partial [Candidatus Aminicenantes bacterium]|nr:hypothetical protein [Candidatus Aminicenantes bacterium]
MKDAQTAAPASRGKKAPLAVALLPLLFMAALLGVGYGVYKIKPQVLLITAAFFTGVVGLLLGYTWREMQQGIVDSIHKAMPAILIMLCVGVLIGTWISCGTIPLVIFYGLKIISPQFFLVTACVVCTVTAMATGTSWGTIGTLGVAFMGIALGLGIPAGPAAGAVVAGAYMGDKMSPLSDIPNLATVVSGSNLFDHIKHMMKSGLPAWLIGLGVYTVVGLGYGREHVQSETVTLITDTLRRSFLDRGAGLNLILLLPMAIVFFFAVAK